MFKKELIIVRSDEVTIKQLNMMYREGYDVLIDKEYVYIKR